jgi:hypothetical protein
MYCIVVGWPFAWSAPHVQKRDVPWEGKGDGHKRCMCVQNIYIDGYENCITYPSSWSHTLGNCLHKLFLDFYRKFLIMYSRRVQRKTSSNQQKDNCKNLFNLEEVVFLLPLLPHNQRFFVPSRFNRIEIYFIMIFIYICVEFFVSAIRKDRSRHSMNFFYM